MEPNIAIIMGSKSDLPIAEKICDTLDQLEVTYSLNIYSAHRTPRELSKFVSNIDALQNYKVIIAIAGLSAALGGAIAAQTTKPVIGVPISSTNLDGMDALLSTVQMPPGIPVASVGINAAQNAALMAARIVSVTRADSSTGLTGRLENYMAEKRKAVLDDNAKVSFSTTAEGIFENSKAKFKFKLPN